jgi:hypothetical protein
MGYAAVIHFGVRKRDGVFEGHSWVTLEDKLLGERGPVERFTRVYSYPDGQIPFNGWSHNNCRRRPVDEKKLDSGKDAENTKEIWDEPKLAFAEPKLTRHGELSEVTGQFFGAFSPPEPEF